MKTNKELSLEIREKIKAKGIKRGCYSVRVLNAGYSTAIRIQVKDIKINPAIFKEIVEGYEAISRDERTYEILSGGNTYVNVSYDSSVLRDETGKFIDTAKGVFATASKENNDEIADFGYGRKLLYSRVGETCYISSDDDKEYGRHSAYGEWDIAEALAIFMAIGTFKY
jgi:hypothetical protein